MTLRRFHLGGDDALVDSAVAEVRRGAVVVLPTETVYGFAASPRLLPAQEAVAALKGRSRGRPRRLPWKAGRAARTLASVSAAT